MIHDITNWYTYCSEPQQTVSVPLTQATCFGNTDLFQALNTLYWKLKIQCMCIEFVSSHKLHKSYSSCSQHLGRRNREGVPKRRHVKFRSRGIAQNKACSIQDRAKVLNQEVILNFMYRGADKSLARPGRKQATATEDFYVHISYL